MFRHPLNPRPLPQSARPASAARSAIGDELMSLCLKAQFQAMIERTSAPDCGCLEHYEFDREDA